MTYDPAGLRTRLNQAVSARVNAQLDDRDAAIRERIDRLDAEVVAMQETLSTLQGVLTQLAASTGDRLRTIEAALESRTTAQ